ncbi:MAG: glycyl-radical enzyme activating protein, partial [Planctomycetota bacterium]
PESWRTAAEPGEGDKVYGETMTVGRVMEEVLRDRAFYKRSGGGLTLSGGEPTMQQEFCLALLSEAKQADIHTCLDTSGLFHDQLLEKLAPLVDLFYFDYKATGEELHRRLTGVAPGPILENLGRLYAKGCSIVLRCPFVPGINVSAEHLAELASISKRFPDLKGIEVLPYHRAGRHKYDELCYPRPELRSHEPDESEVEGWLAELRFLGADRVRRG